MTLSPDEHMDLEKKIDLLRLKWRKSSARMAAYQQTHPRPREFDTSRFEKMAKIAKSRFERLRAVEDEQDARFFGE